jgi:hypothetical protein
MGLDISNLRLVWIAARRYIAIRLETMHFRPTAGRTPLRCPLPEIVRVFLVFGQ